MKNKKLCNDFNLMIVDKSFDLISRARRLTKILQAKLFPRECFKFHQLNLFDSTYVSQILIEKVQRRLNDSPKHIIGDGSEKRRENEIN